MKIFKSKHWVLIVVAFVVIYAYLDLSETICTLTKEESEKMILKEIKRRGFNLSNLNTVEKDINSCSYSALYSGAGEKIEYVVGLDPIHGIELRSWDFNRND